MLASCVYPYTRIANVPDRLDAVWHDLTTTGRAEHGWTTWTKRGPHV
jgi:hypothetical protein